MALLFSHQVYKDLEKETKEVQEKLLVLFRVLETGATLSMPVSRSLVGFPGLKELRVRDARGIVRVFYFIQRKDVILILHLFRKKTQKTPRNEIYTAMQRLNKMKEDFSD